MFEPTFNIITVARWFYIFSVYFLIDVSPIHNFHQQFLHQKDLLGKLVLSYHCEALALIFEVDASVFITSNINYDE